MDGDLYDEFGNYIGPDLESDESEGEQEQEGYGGEREEDEEVRRSDKWPRREGGRAGGREGINAQPILVNLLQEIDEGGEAMETSELAVAGQEMAVVLHEVYMYTTYAYCSEIIIYPLYMYTCMHNLRHRTIAVADSG